MRQLFISSVLTTTVLWAGPPMITEDPFVPNKGQIELNLASEYEKREHSTVLFPFVDFNYGVTETFQVTVGGSYVFSHDFDDTGAVELAAKWLFYSGDFFAMAIAPVYTSFPIHTDLDEGESYELSLPMSFTLSDNLSLIAALNYVVPQYEKDFYEFGTYLQYGMDQHTFFLEGFFERDAETYHVYSLMNLGYSYQFDPNTALLLSAGRDLDAQEREASIAYVAMQFLF